MTKQLRLFSLLFIMIIGTLMGCDVDASESEIINTVIPIKIDEVMMDTVEKTYVTIGEVIPSNQVDVYLSSVGEIENIFAEPGDYLERGMPLIQLKNDNTNTILNTTESQLRTVRDNLAIQYNAALDTYNQQKILFESGATSQNTLNTTYDQLLLTQRQYQDARISYNNQLSSLQSTVDDLLIKSPINGHIASVNVKVGQNAANQIAATVIDKSILYVRTMVSSELKKTLTLDQAVRLHLEGTEGIVDGQVSLINEIPDLNNKLFEVRIKIIEDIEVSVGDFSEVEFVTQSYKALLVPSSSIVRKGIEKYVFVYETTGLKKVILETGLSKDDWIEVISDELSETSIIVVRGQNNLRVEDNVEVIK